ncbi:hypothetical protein RBI13_22335 [Alcaligenaceae bacterium A4P071]|nr:hypothetical protein [Alcaligenaceae bacterium A4P071]
MATSNLITDPADLIDPTTGRDNGALGPGDSSDSGSDTPPNMRGRDTDSQMTGDRAGVGLDDDLDEGDDLNTDHIAGEAEAGVSHTPPDPVKNGG